MDIAEPNSKPYRSSVLPLPYTVAYLMDNRAGESLPELLMIMVIMIIAVDKIHRWMRVGDIVESNSKPYGSLFYYYPIQSYTLWITPLL